jgi:voltage-gated potassium channel
MLSDWAMFFLALLLIPVLLIEETSADPNAVRLATATNAAIWAAFALDYAVGLWRAADRRAYVGRNWAELALIVVSPPLLVPPEAQALRVLRALRLVRSFAVVALIATRLGRPLTRNAALGLVGILVTVVLLGGVLVFALEPRTFPSIVQAYAWAVATLMTLGRAEPVPATAAARAVSTLIIVVGLGTLAALAASLASRGASGTDRR